MLQEQRMVSQILSSCTRTMWRHAAYFFPPQRPMQSGIRVAVVRSITSGSKANSQHRILKVPVLIVGGGPVGLTLSSLLSHMGVPSMLVEKSEKLTTHPQAHLINNRTMEIFRHLDGLASEIESLQPPLDQWRKFSYCLTMTCEPLGTVDHFASDKSENGNQRSPTSIAHFSQNRLLPLLLRRAQSRFEKLRLTSSAAAFKPVLMGHECTTIHLQKNHVLAVIEPQLQVGTTGTSHAMWPTSLSYDYSAKRALQISGRMSRVLAKTEACLSAQPFSVACDWLVAADGARSWSRKTMGVKMEGEGGMENLINVHFVSKDLGKMLAEKNPAMLYFVFNPDVVMVVVAHDIDKGELVAQIPYYPPQQEAEDFSPEVCKNLILKAAGLQPGSGIEVDVRSIRRWTMTAQVADQFVCGGDRVFLVGDAAHQFPPAGAFGMNTGIQDVHNLAWKLAAVYRGFASKDLLKTYETERKPIAIANSKLSISNFKAAISVPAALGLDPDVLRVLHASLNQPPASFLPRDVQKAILEQAMSAGRLQVSQWVLDSRNPLGRMRLANMRRIFDRGESLQLQFPAEDLGFCYVKGALVPEESAGSLIAESGGPRVDQCVDPRSTANPDQRRNRAFTPRAIPGARLPHWEIQIVGERREEMSSLDLVPCDGSLLLIVPRNEFSEFWEDAARQAASRIPAVPLKIAIVWPCSHNRSVDRSAAIGPEESAAIGPEGSAAISSEGSAAISSEGSAICHEGDDRFEKVGCWWDIKGRDSNKVSVVDVRGRWQDICRGGETAAAASDPVLLVRPDGHVAWRSNSNRTDGFVEIIDKVLTHVLCQPPEQEIIRAAHAM